MRSRKHAKKRRLVLLASGVAEITMALGAFAQSPPFEPPTKHLFAASYANEWPLLSASEYEPRSRDALFGGAPAKEESPPAKVNGFIDGLAAYTYSGPAHWSRAVARVQVSAQGQLSEDIKWKVGGRADVDGIYFGSNFYLDAVKHNQRTSFGRSANRVGRSRGIVLRRCRFSAGHARISPSDV